jgi:asparagine N-glycosylation enzyme membrane subunit Stt3
MEKNDIKKYINDAKKYVMNPKIQWATTIIIFLIILFMSSSIRLSNWDLLTDSTSGEKIPLALDPYYFLRIAETVVENDGSLPPVDSMRGNAAWHPEIMPRVVVGMWRVSNVFGDYSLRAVDVFSPVAFYFIGLILFFFLCYLLTGSKVASLISSGLLAFSPTYLYRTMAGFADHESIGMVAVFACLIFYIFALKNFEKDWKRTILYGLGLGFLSSLVLASWGGSMTLILMLIPISFLMYWLIKTKDEGKAISFYVIWIASTLIMPGLFNVNLINGAINRMSGTYGLIVPIVFGFILIDTSINWLIKKKKLKIKKENRILWNIGILTILGSTILTILGKNIFELIKSIWHAVLFPFGTGRVGLTVAENAQPYLNDWINQSGSTIFYLFLLGVFLIGFELGKAIKTKKHILFFGLSWTIMISAMLFSRISSASNFNGENFISQAVYLIGVGTFIIYFIWLNMHKMFDKEKVDTSLIISMILMFIVVLNGRSAIRTFFLITPFVLLSVGYFVVKILTYAQKSKEKVFKIILLGIFLFALGGVLLSVNTYKDNITNQAKFTGPSASLQWQSAMSWVRENTEKDDKFAHWWDYGYWVQTLGKRATIADGGHFQGFFNGNERIGRYLLTTDKPASAYSLMKTQNITHLLIDPTDLGKYSAYSKIGSDDDWDRFSMIPIGISDPKNIQETRNQTITLYKIQGVVDEDTYYEDIFLPGPSYDEYGRVSYKSYLGGVFFKQNENQIIQQPEAVYFYNNVQYKIPLRYVHINGEIYDFGSGLNGTLKLIPSVQQSSQGLTINQIGAGIYLSPRTGKTLFSKLYLMNDPFNEYTNITLVHSEDAQVIKVMKAQGANINDFIYYQGFRGPIKIWNVNYPKDTPVYEEFFKPQAGYADVDWRFE